MLPKKSTRIRKEEIVRAALEVIGKHGVRSLTIAAIAATAGMSEANLYRHFGGKDEIFSAVTDYIGTAVMGKAATIAAGSCGTLEKLEAIFMSHMSLIAEQPGIPRLVFSEDIQLGNRKLAETLAFRMSSYVEIIAGVIAAGIQDGELRQEISPRETAITFLGMMPITVLRWNLAGTSFNIKKEADLLWGNFLGLIR